MRLLEADFSPLHSAAAAGDATRLRLLLKRGAGIDALHDGSTALHCAAAGGHLECVLALVEAGAVVGLLDVGGQTAFDLARRPLFQRLQACRRQPARLGGAC